MRLLPKSEVDKAKAADRQREVDEGKKLAGKVDDLRALRAEEQKGLEAFREKTVKHIREEIDPLVARKTELEYEITQLEDKRARLLVPLDAKWREVATAEALCREREIEVGVIEREIDAKRANLAAHERELHIESERVADERERSKEMVASSGRILSDANEALLQAQDKAHAIIAGAEGRSNDALHREVRVAARERDVAMHTEKNATWDKDLHNREVALADKYATLARTVTRLQKQYGSNNSII